MLDSSHKGNFNVSTSNYQIFSRRFGGWPFCFCRFWLQPRHHFLHVCRRNLLFRHIFDLNNSTSERDCYLFTKLMSSESVFYKEMKKVQLWESSSVRRKELKFSFNIFTIFYSNPIDRSSSKYCCFWGLSSPKGSRAEMLEQVLVLKGD